ncbi:MAG: integrin alpha, partial [Legionellales bacterium]
MGCSISSGDINGDGIADLLMGSYGAPVGTRKGLSYVVYGSRIPFPATFNLASLNGTNGFVVNGIDGGGYLGCSISSGDINGDGIS